MQDVPEPPRGEATADSLDIAALRVRYQTRDADAKRGDRAVLARIAARGDDEVWIDRPARRRARRQARGWRRRDRRASRSTASRSRSRTISTSPASRPPPPAPSSPTSPPRSAPVVRAADRRRRHPDRQDQSRPVRHRAGRHALALRRAALRVQPRLHLRRLEFRLGGGGGGGAGELRARHRHRRVRARAGGVQQPDRAEADARPAQHARRRAGLPLARLRVDLRADRRRRARRCWRRRQGFDPADPFSRDADARRRRHGAAQLAGCRFGVPRADQLRFFGNARARRRFAETLRLAERLGGGWSRSISTRSWKPRGCSTTGRGSPNATSPSATSSTASRRRCIR